MTVPTEQSSTKSARILFKPWGIASSVAAGLVAGQVFQRTWTRVSPTGSDDPPKPLESEYALREVLLAAALQGAVYAVVKAGIQRGTARAFERWTGEWPGD